MVDLGVITSRGGETVLREAALKEFKASLRGALIVPEDDGYDDARTVWNGMIDKRPGLIVGCAGVADVISAVRFAREHELLVSVRGGGHNVAGSALCDGGMVIDLSRMRGVHVDPVQRTARAEPGVTLADLDHETQAFGFAVPAGIVSTTGIAGLTLGGGFGWLTRKHGLTCDNLLSADVVTADGQMVTASQEENADLFWGIRGGGGNFGIVTSFEYRMQAVGPTVLAGLVVHPMAKAPELLRFFRDFVADAPDELTAIPVLRLAPPAPFLPEHVHGKPIAAVFVCYSGPVEEGERVLRPLREFGPPLAEVIAPKPFTAHQAMLDPMQPPGRSYYWKSDDLPGLSDGAIDTVAANSEAITSPHTIVALFQLGGATSRVAEDATAYSHRSAEYALNCNASWVDGEPERHILWARDFSSAMQPFSSGVYVNFLGDEGEERARAAYGGEKYDRLVALKNRYDHTNFFRVNQNIKPTV